MPLGSVAGGPVTPHFWGLAPPLAILASVATEGATTVPSCTKGYSMNNRQKVAAMLSAAALTLGLSVAVALPASAASCGFSAYDYGSAHARSSIDQGGACDRQRTKARYSVGSGYTYTAYGSLGAPYNGDWIATSDSVPSGKSVTGSMTQVPYLGNTTYWTATH